MIALAFTSSSRASSLIRTWFASLMRSVRYLDLVTPALPLPLALLRFRFSLPELQLARLPQAPSFLQQLLPPLQKLPLGAVLLQQSPPSPLLQRRPLHHLRLQPPRFPRSLRFHSLPRPPRGSRRTGSPTDRSCPPSSRRCPGSPSIAPASSKRASPRN